MARIKLSIDTDIFIDYLKGMPPAKAVFRSRDIDIYCSILTKKELLSKTGLKDSERKKIIKPITLDRAKESWNKAVYFVQDIERYLLGPR